MPDDSVLILDIGGKILWANRVAHETVGLPPGGLLGRNYLEFCPVDTHAELLRLHKLKIDGETVRFRFDLGGGRVLSITSGPVHIEDRLYLFVVGRKAVGPPAGDETIVGMVAAAESLGEKRHRVDLNEILVGALKDEAKTLKGKLTLVPGNPGPVLVRPWPIRMVLRRLLLQVQQTRGRLEVETGKKAGQAWVKIALPPGFRSEGAELEFCRRIARDHGGRLQVRGRVVRLSLPGA